MPTSSLLLSFALLSSLIAPIAAQTWTSCDPLNRTDCPTNPALGTSHTYNFTDHSAGNTWNTTAGTILYHENGAEYTIDAKGDAPTMQSKFYIFFGEVEVHLKAATGQGIVSSIVLQSDDLDEVDWEFTGTNTTHGETNYYGKGNTTAAATRAFWHPMESSPQENFHNYTIRWTKERIEWFIDSHLVRTLEYADANGGASFPQSPMNVRLGIWAGGDEDNNNYTVAWAGGETDYDDGPYTMYVNSVRVADFSSGKEYKYGDQTGSWESIQIVPGNSTAADDLNRPLPKTVAQRWAGLSTGAKIAVGAVAGAVGLAIIGFSTICCVAQRRKGKQERALADANWEKDHAETMAYKARLTRQRNEV